MTRTLTEAIEALRRLRFVATGERDEGPESCDLDLVLDAAEVVDQRARHPVTGEAICPWCRKTNVDVHSCHDAYERLGELLKDSEAEVRRLRDIISEGEAAGYEEGMAALQEEVARLRAEREHLVSQAGPDSCADLFARCERADEEVARLRGLARDAIELADEGWSYAPPYFRDKWSCDVRLAALHTHLDENTDTEEPQC